MLPSFTSEGGLPVGVHVANWHEFRSRFGVGTSRRVWLLSRLRALLDLAAGTGKLRRVFVWGSFVTTKPAPKDLDVLLIMNDDFEVERIADPVKAIFDSVRAKLLFESDVFWARTSNWGRSPGALAPDLSNFQELSKTRYRGIGVAVIQTDDQMLLAQECIGNLRKVLLEARKVHSPQDYSRLAEPILLEIQQREQEILEYLSRGVEPVAS